MHLTTLLFAALSSATLISAENLYYRCEFAKDNSGFIQHPYCCDDYVPAPHTNKAKEGKQCTKLDHVVQHCPNGDEVKCCYEIGPGRICTSSAKVLTEAQI
ncbi:hypothetical protein ASPWEDRAFT_171654 [Aspergillus wentii DTO 134E9]|uniref:Uncharacterized protein n=1 Tax=Aspergillus wentii DTO 134E9 TaxID=1073089 RepID=A0A1L9RIY2_ASPWE|nr:uncharacterized protein ASPWEDRAFT_171654 [Aspergillus wentii DTO 134E9]KAI9932220.1 hypothetical protein MW887_009730 [Aspergillus wentii]OJJ34818.1 hypothetical protein ASPWEDRAFT_171654 [Aspergillus wentii DTO 134E9]